MSNERGRFQGKTLLRRRPKGRLFTDWPIGGRSGQLLLIGSLLLTLAPVWAEATSWVVSPEGPFFTLPEALSRAQDGDRVEVRGGTYTGPITVERSVHLIGFDNPILDGGGVGTVLIVSAPNVRIEGFVIRNSGKSLDREDAGIVVQTAENVAVVKNRIENTLFGIYVKDSPRALLQENRIRGMALDLPRRGDGIRVWQSPEARIVSNTVQAVRDCILWFSDRSLVEGNTILGSRYGIHLMYDNDIRIRRNLFAENHVGAFLMYSRRISLIENLFRNNRGPSGYGVGLKDTDRVVGEENLFLGNRIGIYLDNSPWSMDVTNEFRRNAFVYNDMGVTFLPSVKRNVFVENTFLENEEQVALHGEGQLSGNVWTVDGRGNFWSDYAGYDADRDGLGDLPYRPRSLFEMLMDRHPVLRLFRMSPVQQAIDLATRAFPILLPEPKLSDEAPLMKPIIPAAAVGRGEAPSGSVRMLAFSGGAILTAFLLLGLGRWRPREEGTQESEPSLAKAGKEDAAMIEIRGLTKRFGRFTAVDDFHLSVAPGEAVALWGPNGAGKTTIIKCLLGLLRAEGTVRVNGYDLQRNSKEVRRSLGYVPQELAFHSDLSARETVQFYARLQGIAGERVEEVLAQVELSEHAQKVVSALSGGMKQRLALAIALLRDPPLLVLDEPTSNLDARAREEFLRLLIEQKQRGKTLLFTSHRLEEVETLADRVIALERGRLQAECAPRMLATALGIHVGLNLYIPESDRQRALEVLRTQGYAAEPSSTGVRVQVLPADKAVVIHRLVEEKVRLEDFEVENGAGNGWKPESF